MGEPLVDPAGAQGEGGARVSDEEPKRKVHPNTLKALEENRHKAGQNPNSLAALREHNEIMAGKRMPKSYKQAAQHVLLAFRQKNAAKLEQALGRMLAIGMGEVEGMQDKTQVAALKDILDRCVGKPAQQIDIGTSEGSTHLIGVIDNVAQSTANRAAQRFADAEHGRDAGVPAGLLPHRELVDMPEDEGGGSDDAGWESGVSEVDHSGDDGGDGRIDQDA